jgi:hypothetical protein
MKLRTSDRAALAFCCALLAGTSVDAAEIISALPNGNDFQNLAANVTESGNVWDGVG